MTGKSNVTTESFIAKANAVHNERYDYSSTVYVAAALKITIICKVHGQFLQTPANHLAGRGCPACRGGCLSHHAKSNVLFIAEAKAFWGENTYDYSKVVYETSFKPVKIICPEHGEFKKRPDNFLAGSGCNHCPSRTYKWTAEEFFKLATEKHKGKYDYSNVVYGSPRHSAVFFCKDHGSFVQYPINHLLGLSGGCRKCIKLYPTEHFLAKAHLVWGDRYDYSMTKYQGVSSPVVIVCYDHGPFQLSNPNQHLDGIGCPFCEGNG